ncbi:securin SKDI_04G3390 [Saccharomyces kudriavzevii IFO 1802]|uniref:PDS1-like protein n=2 Tax=Saccharomyces kudriavzevii (strain ATCC MYA-4449 / AS 2.2408 / CBS 8840 / NBRC 1802 / NCYC 2889) TaxID=226230 RepID=J6EA88_SACK1|nr:uncharacterized protein SKDI_04G3390 [Saccharomyces kudriavzevii IFO 1802]EJT41444.1 PDS1-like protein [Saccharomyces kudriavzevii IFO 1802]CAI4058171.1 hypothetical protein SKDI_04G3390 [Saccharomyces kudriavzevii IFO 1802]
MPANEDKENNIVYTGNESSGINFPQTPAHLLKRSHSNVLKPPVRLDQLKKDLNSNNGKGLKYIQGGKEVSPTKRLHTHAQQQGRLPLAAKDNNRSKSFVFVSETTNLSKDSEAIPQQQNTLSIRKNDQLRQLSQISRNRTRANYNELLNNSRKLQKYGSVLGYNALPKMKSLVLKDLAGPAKNQESSDDDDGSEGPESKLGVKLQNAFLQQHSSDDEHESNGDIGLFNNQGGLQQLIKNTTKGKQGSKEEDDDDDDYEIEIAPQRQEPLPYVPDGYPSFQREDIEKLRTFNSPYELDLEDHGDSVDRVGLLSLEVIDEEAEQDGTAHTTGDPEACAAPPLLSKRLKEGTASPTINLLCSGEGLEPEELEDLLT